MYVVPYNSALEGEIKKIESVQGRLKAFPGANYKKGDYTCSNYPYYVNFENRYNTVILDSGAFGLSKANKEIDDEYMFYLSQFYEFNREIINAENIICVAPDKFLNPQQSMYNFIKWRKCNYGDVAAVLQSTRKGFADYRDLIKQAEFYSKYTDTIFFSNPGLKGDDARAYHLDKLFEYLKTKLSTKWVHILGAGWSLKDIKSWIDIGNFDSLDSIAYYTEPMAYNANTPIEAIRRIMEVAR
jgi:hypothetical protein